MERFKLRHLNAFLPERLSTFLFVLGTIGLGISFYVGQKIFWSDSEMWPVAVARNMFSPYSMQDYYVKPLFNVLFFVVHWIGIWTDILPLDIARALMGLNLIAIAVLVFRIIKRLTQNELLALCSTVFLITSITMLEQGTRIRSDLLVCTLNLLTLDLILNKGAKDLRVWIPSLLSLLITPKAIYWVLALLPFFPSLEHFPKQKVRKFLMAAGIFIILLFILRYPTILGITKYFLATFTREGSGLDYFNRTRFEHWERAITKDMLFWFLVFARLVWVRSFKGFDAMFVILFVALLFHPERMPFFIASLMPFFLIAAAAHSAFAGLFKKMQIRGGWVFIVVLGLLFAFAMQRFLVRTTYILTKHNNTEQREVIEIITEYLSNRPYVLVYDPVGIVYKTPTPYDWFIGPGEIDGNRFVMSLLKNTIPDIVLYTMRVRWLEPEVYQLLQEHYVNMGGGVYAHFPKIELKQGQKYLTAAEILEQLPEGKVIVNPEMPIHIFVYDGYKNDISAHGRWYFTNQPRLSLTEPVPLKTFESSVARVELPANAKTVRISFWGVLNYNIPNSLQFLFRFDSEL